MHSGAANAVKIMAVAVMVALGLWLAGAQRAPVGQSGPARPLAADPARPTGAKAAAPAKVGTPLPTDCAALGGMIVPVQGVRPDQLTDTFNDARSEGRLHDAIDIMAPLGTPAIAAAPGKVEKLFLSDAGGNTVYVRSPDRQVIYYYAHLDHYAPGLAEGMQLAKGASVGAVGFTGNANPAAPHLHFAMMTAAPEMKWWEAKQALNPYPLLAGRATSGPAPPCR
jgi:murein DD-endopeptidase MepM/ murein hydrolase activator NlpD